DQARAGAVVEAVRVRDQGAVAAGEGDDAGGGVPAHALAHEAADGPDGKVHGAVVEQGVDGVPGGVGEAAGHAVHGDGDVRGEAGGDAGGGGAAVRCAGDGSAGAGPAEGDGPGAGVPVDVLAHELANGPDGQIGGAAVEDGVDLVAVDVVEGLGRAVYGDGDVRGEL